MRYSDKEVFRNSEQRRDDEDLLAKVEQVRVARSAALLSAAKKLKQASDELRALSVFEHDEIYSRCESAAWNAYHRVDIDAEFMQGIEGECYISNLAAGRLGYQIEQMGDDFYKYFPREAD